MMALTRKKELHVAKRKSTKLVRPDGASDRVTHLTLDDTPVRPGINAQTPSSMPRAEDDEATRAQSPEFNDRAGSGKHTADRLNHF